MVTMVQDDNGLADGKPPYLLYINFHFSVKQASKYISKLVYEFPFIMDDPSIDAWYVQKSEIQSNVTWFCTWIAWGSGSLYPCHWMVIILWPCHLTERGQNLRHSQEVAARLLEPAEARDHVASRFRHCLILAMFHREVGMCTWAEISADSTLCSHSCFVFVSIVSRLLPAPLRKSWPGPLECFSQKLLYVKHSLFGDMN